MHFALENNGWNCTFECEARVSAPGGARRGLRPTRGAPPGARGGVDCSEFQKVTDLMGPLTAARVPRRPRLPMRLVRLAVHYGDDPGAGLALENDLAEAMAQAGTRVEAILRSPVDAATRVHLGPRALGIVVAPALARG